MGQGLAHGELAEALTAAAQLVKYAGGRRKAAVSDLGALLGKRLDMLRIAMAAVEEGGNLADLVEQLVGPVTEQDIPTTALQFEPGTAAFLDYLEEVVGSCATLAVCQAGAIVQRTEQQEGVEKACLAEVDAQWQVRVDIQATHFDVLNAACPQRLQRPLASGGDALRADIGVVLVFDLQHVGVELLPVACGVLGPQRLVRRIRRGDRAEKAFGVAFQVVVAGGEPGLGIVLVTQITHAQAGGVRQVQGVGIEGFELVLATAQKAGIQRRRRAEQIHQQPAVATEVANHADIARRAVVLRRACIAIIGLQHRPQSLRQREIVVNAGDTLHGLAVAQGQPLTVDVLEPADVGAAVLGDRDVRLAR